MNPLLQDLRRLMVRDLETLIREIELMPDDESLWRALPGVTNTVGTFGLHIAGNLQHYVGRVLGGTDYVRDRDREFSQRSGTRAEVVAGLRRAMDVVETVLPRISADTLDAVYPEAVAGGRLSTRLFLTHLSTHLAMHLGQAGYLRRILTANAETTSPTGVKPILDETA
jgi:hypothetical protein